MGSNDASISDRATYRDDFGTQTGERSLFTPLKRGVTLRDLIERKRGILMEPEGIETPLRGGF
jgi:hypothetical protein